MWYRQEMWEFYTCDVYLLVKTKKHAKIVTVTSNKTELMASFRQTKFHLKLFTNYWKAYILGK